MTDVKSDFDQSQKQQEEVPFIVVTKHKDGTEEIHIHDLVVRVPGDNGRVLVQDVNLALKPGDKVALMGESGSGKTTVAKAILNNWDHGSGLIVMPSGLTIVSMSQQAYFPDTTLRAIMNLKPEEKCVFEDKQLTEVLQKVGLEQLVQHIPGQQVKILMDDLLEQTQKIMESYAEQEISDDDFLSVKNDILSRVAPLVKEQFEVVQFIPQEQKDYFKEKLSAQLTGALKKPLAQPKVKELTNAILDDIDIKLAQPLYTQLAATLPEMAHRKRGKIIPYTPAKAKFLANSFEEKLRKYLTSYMKNEDTDDIYRDIRINDKQADYICKAVSDKLREEMKPYISGGTLTQTFNAVTWAVTLPAALLWIASSAMRDLIFTRKITPSEVTRTTSLPPVLLRRASNMAKDLVQNTMHFMERQLVKGTAFTTQLSGGQKQRLMIAIGLLHDADLYVLDEPTAGLDPASKENIYRETMEAVPKGGIVLCITHDESIIKYHTHLAVLEDQTIKMKKINPDAYPSVKQPCVDHICPNCTP